MLWTSFIAIYFVIWFISLIAVLPIGVRREENPEEGHDPGAPVRPYMWWKVLSASLIALVMTWVVWLGFTNEWITLRSY